VLGAADPSISLASTIIYGSCTTYVRAKLHACRLHPESGGGHLTEHYVRFATNTSLAYSLLCGMQAALSLRLHLYYVKIQYSADIGDR